jgi:hypothetical protein
MPKLKETYQQIQERNAREIRQRTRNRVSALQGEEELVVIEDLPDAPIVVAEQSHVISILSCIIVLLALACLLLSQQIYLAKRN